MATDLTLERIQEMKEKLFLAFNHLASPPMIEPTDRDLESPERMAALERAREIWLRRHIETSADRLVGLSNSFASLVLAEAALTTGQVAIIPQPNGPKPSGGREPRELER